MKEEHEKLSKTHGFVTVDGRQEKLQSFKIESPGLFCTHGKKMNPKMGMVKRRIMPEDVIINCSEDSKIPIPPMGHKWKEVRHDNTVCMKKNSCNCNWYLLLSAHSSQFISF